MEERTVGLRDILKTVKKRKGIILICFFLFTLAALVISFMIPPTYEAETTLRIKQSKGLGNSLFDMAGGGGGFNAKQTMSTYAEILKSRSVVQQVIDDTQSEKPKIPAYEGFVKTITTQPLKDTEILKVTVKAKSPEEAEEVANDLVKRFIERMTQLVRQEQGSVKEFIGQRLVEAKKELETSEATLEKYKIANKIMNPEVETKALLDKIKDIDTLNAQNKVALSAAQARLGTTNEQLGSETPGFVADNPLIQQYKGKLAEQEVKLVELTQKYTAKHPEVRAAEAAIAKTRAALNEEIAKVVSANAPSMNPIHQGLLTSKIVAEAEISARDAQRQSIAKVLGEGDQELAKLPSKERGLAQVLRDAKVNQEIYLMLAKRFEEARISEVMEPTDVQIVDVAVTPNGPVSPRKGQNTVIGAFLGLLVGLGLAFAIEFLNKSITKAEDVEEYLDLPVLGSIPDFDKKHQQDSWTDRLKARLKQ